MDLIEKFQKKFNEDFEYYANQSLKNISSNLAAIPMGTENASNTYLSALSTSSALSTTDDSSKIAETLENVEDLSSSEYFNSLNTREQAYQIILKKKF